MHFVPAGKKKQLLSHLRGGTSRQHGIAKPARTESTIAALEIWHACTHTNCCHVNHAGNICIYISPSLKEPSATSCTAPQACRMKWSKTISSTFIQSICCIGQPSELRTGRVRASDFPSPSRQRWQVGASVAPNDVSAPAIKAINADNQLRPAMCIGAAVCYFQGIVPDKLLFAPCCHSQSACWPDSSWMNASTLSRPADLPMHDVK